MKRWLITFAMALAAFAAHAVPTVAEVQAQVQRGNYTQAQSMMLEVVTAKPQSARAHYIYAEILAHNDKFAEAAQETALAKQLDPALKFTDPQKFRAFEDLLARETQRASRPRAGGPLDGLSVAPPRAAAPLPQPVAASSGVPGWVWPAGLVVLAVLAWRWLRRPSASGTSLMASPGGYGAPAGYAPGPYGPSYGPTPGMAPAGSGLLGTGLAAAGGVAAGMLAEKLLERGLEGRRDEGFLDRDTGTRGVPADDRDARALEDRNVDFGSGADNWGDASSDAGSADLGGGGDDGGW